MRHRRPGTDGGPPLTDALGDLVEVTEGVLVVRTRRGDVSVPRDAVVALKPVPSPPSRGPSGRADLTTLQRVADASWPAPERAALGDWTLRAAHGWTRRANSVLALGGPGRSWREALATARDWYATRGLPLLLQVPEDEASALLVPALRSAGLAPFGRTEVLVSDLDRTHLDRTHLDRTHLDRAEPDGVEVRWGAGADPDWIEVYTRQRALHPRVGDAVLVAPGAQLGSTGDGRGAEGGIVRLWTPPLPGPGSPDQVDGWAVLSCLWVSPRQRGRGLGTALTVAAARRAAELGCRGLLLQVLPGNEPATALYRRLGLRRHHRYAYWGAADTAT